MVRRWLWRGLILVMLATLAVLTLVFGPPILSQFYLDRGRYADAERLNKSVFDFLVSVAGPDSPVVDGFGFQLAVVYTK